jgi:hypothetical protein
MAAFTSTESLLLSNSTVAFSMGELWSLKMVMDALPFCWASAIVVITTHNTSKVNFPMMRYDFPQNTKEKSRWSR